VSTINPYAIGWPEFWLRFAVLFFTVAAVLLVISVVLRIFADLWGAVSWVARKGWRR
jgi:hypothetical protein